MFIFLKLFLIYLFYYCFLIFRLVSTYENTIPEMYKLLDDLAYNDENMPKYMELKHRLDVIRIEILNIFHIIIHEPILNIQENV